MPKTQREENKKHGDKLESAVDRAARSSSQGRRDENDGDPAELQDDDDEDVQNDDVEDRRDIDERD